jgi:hypothetical protein
VSQVPINIVVTVHEVGDPSVFLAALASAMQSSGGDFSKAVVSAVLPPPGTQSLQQLIQKNQASVSALGATYYKDLAAFNKECANPSQTNSAEGGYLDALYQLAVQDCQTAITTAKSFGVPSGIASSPLPTRPKCGSSGI